MTTKAYRLEGYRCERCKGNGFVLGPKHWWNPLGYRIRRECRACDGSGLEKVEVKS